MKELKMLSRAVLLVLIFAGCGEKIAPGEKEIQRPLVQGISIERVVTSEEENYYEATGTVRARNTAQVAARIMGEVKETKVQAGSMVKEGDILLVISSPDISAKVQAAEEGIEEAKKTVDMMREKKTLTERTFERYSKLFEEKAVSQQEFDEIRMASEVAALGYEQAQKTQKRAEAGLEEAKAFRGYSVIRSPITGIVAEKKIENGSMAVPGATLIVIEERGYRVEVPVNESLLDEIRIGDIVSVSVDAMQMRLSGRVGEIVRQIDPATRSFTVKVDIQDASKQLRGGSYAKVKFPFGKKSGIFVPAEAVVSRGELNGVYTVSTEGVITFRLVRVGKRTDSRVEIVSGLNDDETIIAKGTEKAVDGGKAAE